MKISSVSNVYCNQQKNSNLNKKTSPTSQKPSFKSIFLEKGVYLGGAVQITNCHEFLRGDALLLNKIAQEYPNQDCFIKAGDYKIPYLEFREKPPSVSLFSVEGDDYNIHVKANDKDYPSEPLILYRNSKLGFFIGLPSLFSTNPSLPFTVRIGYELHKKLLEKKIRIQEALGFIDKVNIGETTMIKRAHREIEELETAVTRYLLEAAYAKMTDKNSSLESFEDKSARLEYELEAERLFDIITSATQNENKDFGIAKISKKNIDVCETIMKAYPYYEENKERIKELSDFMYENNLVL